MKILLFADLHCHAFKSYSTILPNGRNSRLQDSINILDEIEKLATVNKVDGILFAGDLFHLRPGLGNMKISTFNAVYEAIVRLKVGRSFVGLLVGNHDQGDKAGKDHSIYAFSSIVTVMDKPIVYEFKSSSGELLDVMAIPAQSDSTQIKSLIDKNMEDINPDSTILLGHLPIAGANVGCNFIMPTDKAATVDNLQPHLFKRVFLGDFHKPQTIQPGVEYIGATHHHNWGDAGQRRGCLIWDTETEVTKFHHLESAPQFIKVLYEKDHEQWSAEAKGNFIRIVHSIPLLGPIREKIKSDYLDRGAKLVEFWEEKPKDQLNLVSNTSEFQPTMDQEDMISVFVNKELPDNLDEELLISMGKDILNVASERNEQ